MNLHGMMHDRAPVAQLDRAPDFESVGRRFESCRARQINSKCRMQNANTRCLQHWVNVVATSPCSFNTSTVCILNLNS